MYQNALNTKTIRFHSLVDQLLLALALLFFTGCDVQAAAAPLSPAQATGESNTSFYDLLPITPQPNGDLCWDISPWPHAGLAAWEEVIREIPVESGVGSGMGLGDLPGAAYIGLNTYTLEAGIPLTGTYHMIYPKTTINVYPISLRFMVILDERQLSGAIDQSKAKYVDVVFQPGDDVAFTLNIPALDPGIHDLIVLAILGAEDEPDSLGIIKYTAHRITLIAGSEQYQKLARRYTKYPAIGSIAKNDPSISLNFTLAGNTDTLQAWVWPETRLEVAPGEILDFNIQAGFQAVENGDYPVSPQPQPDVMQSALLFFLDYEQIDYSTDSSVLYWEITSDTAYTNLPVQLISPTEPGRHDILVVRINYPGIPGCILQGPPDGLYFSYLPFAGRVAIEVSD